MFITDLNHFLDEKGAIGPKSGPARRLGEFLGRVVASTSAQERGAETEPVLCRHRKCKWPIATTIADDDAIEWECAVRGTGTNLKLAGFLLGPVTGAMIEPRIGQCPAGADDGGTEDS
ncbi:MAG: hypothetical protein IPO58_24600 [Betaproteobacteria bacterium]|nr:hypothetical protein [Betaproteobacteria bacterium]